MLALVAALSSSTTSLSGPLPAGGLRATATFSSTSPVMLSIEELRREGAEVVARREQLRTMQQMREMKGRVVKVRPEETQQQSPTSKYSIEELAAEGLAVVAKRKAYSILLEQKLQQLAAKREAPDEEPADAMDNATEDSQVTAGTRAPLCTSQSLHLAPVTMMRACTSLTTGD